MPESLISAVKDIGNCLWPFLKPHVDYWWCFDSNIQDLTHKVWELETQIFDLKQKIEEARPGGPRPASLLPWVEPWLKASTEKLEEAEKILLPDDNIPKAWNLISRYSLGKNAKKTAEEIAKLLEIERNFDNIAYPRMASPPTLELKQKARLRLEVGTPGVEELLKASTQKLAEVQRILPDDHIPKASNLISPLSLGKKAKKTAEEIAELRNDGNFNPVADPAPPAAMASPPRRSTMNIESRKGIEDEIIDCLKKNSVDMIGICGVGGVGKTTMAQRIGKRVKEEHLFDEVVTVTVSPTVDMPKIQNEIADLLKLKLDESSMAARANQLRRRLMDAKRKIIIFDDVWESLRFEEFGFPIESNFERCKVLLTSRYADACKGIKNRKVFKLKILEGDEGWLLFKDKAGDCVEGSRLLNSVAKEVAAECKGLPIALVTVGLALRDVTNIQTWQNSLSQLRQSDPEDFPEVLRDVYKPLKSSYDYLDSDRERSLFLLCCLFPEDFNISVEQLTWYSMGLGLFEGITNIKEIRDRTHSLVEKLKSRFLLIDVEKKSKKGLEVKMHDVIRDVAIYIGSIEKNGFLKSLTSKRKSSDVNCNWMSVDISNDQMEVPVLSRFPNLRLLMLLTLSSNEFYDISRISFEGMENLNVLSFQNISIPSLPSTLGLLENLQALRLFHCQVENISVISELTSLKFLVAVNVKILRSYQWRLGD